MASGLRKKLSFLIAIPIPRFDQHRKALAKTRIDQAVGEVVEAFSRWFGGARVLHSVGAYRMMDGTVIVDDEEPAVVAMTSRAEYRKRKADIERLADLVGTGLGQESMAVIACPAEGFLVFRG
ncbi:MAG: hypothetical protein HY077_10035 [Elusimicrobia bacterium]|nr:hypothetical protein [Elusimicrobiota bacterium]